MIPLRIVLRGAAIVVLGLLLAAAVGHTNMSPGVGEAFSRLSRSLGGGGIEDTEDLFMLVVTVIALAVSTLVVVGSERAIRRARRQRRFGMNDG